MLVANKMHSNKFGELPKSFDSYMILKYADGRKNIININSNAASATNNQMNSNKPRSQSDKVSEKALNSSDNSLKAPVKPILPINLNKISENHMYNDMNDNTKKTIENKSQKNVNVPLLGKSDAGIDAGTKVNEDVLQKNILDLDPELDCSLRGKRLLDNMSETNAKNSVETTVLKTRKRKSLFEKPGPKSKNKKPVMDDLNTSPVTLRSVRKAVKNSI